MSDIFDYANPPAKKLETYQLMDQVAMREIAYLKAVNANFIRHLAERYAAGEYCEVGCLCDDTLDQSGRLLGEVRRVAYSLTRPDGGPAE